VKERRRLIIVTHNPNVAVLGDAEQIIVIRPSMIEARLWHVAPSIMKPRGTRHAQYWKALESVYAPRKNVRLLKSPLGRGRSAWAFQTQLTRSACGQKQPFASVGF
jgi:hypothetical protein